MENNELQVSIGNESFFLKSRYKNLCKIGKGAYGTVYCAFDQTTGKHVAIKRFVDPFSDETTTKTLLREVHLLMNLRHENIIHLCDVQTPPSNKKKWKDVYIVTEYMESSLKEILESKQTLTEDHLRHFMYQIVSGVNYLHSANVMHRDLKPDNILLNKDCHLCICDFGLARTNEKGDLSEYVVTRWYRAPEILLGVRDYTPAVDMWSIGCIFAELISGKPLFPANSTYEQLACIFSILGTPDSSTLAAMNISENCKKHIKQMPTYTKKPIYTIMPKGTSQAALDLLDKLLVIDPKQRCTAEEALNHRFLRAWWEDTDEIKIASEHEDMKYIKKLTKISDMKEALYHMMRNFEEEDYSEDMEYE